MIGNTNLTLESYGNGINNSNNVMEFVDVDSDPSTLNSSSATLQFSTENGAIPECSNILFAGLYWTGRAHDGSNSPDVFTISGIQLDKQKVKVKGPASGSYTDFTANPGNIYYPQTSAGFMYSAFVEITDYVRANGIGEYTVANIATREGNGGATGYYGGWGLIVVYENSKMKWRDVTIFDGHAYVQGNSVVNYELPVTGFNTVQSGPVNMKLGLMAGEGDVGISGDYFRIRDYQDTYWETLNHASNSTGNFFNSSVETGGTPRNPNLQNNTGLDIAMFNIPNSGNTVITNNQTSTRFQYGSTQDTYVIFCIAMAVDAYIPEVAAIISTESINGIPVGSGPVTVQPGQTIQYKIEVKNLGTEEVNNTRFVIPVPYLTSFVMGSESTAINFAPAPSPNNVYFDPLEGPTGSIIWDFGTLPMPPVGFPETVLAELTFDLTVTDDCFILTNPDCPPVVTMAGGLVTGEGAISGANFRVQFIQGYIDAGLCIGEPITDPIQIAIDAAAYVAANCSATPSSYDVLFCNYSNPTIPTSTIAANFPPGVEFYNTNSITPSSIKFDDTTPFPATPGTQTYFAIPLSVPYCYYTFTITVQQPISANAVTTSQVSCTGANDGSIDLTVSGGTPPISFVWTGPGIFSSTSEDLASLASGTYNVTITDNLGCSATSSASVTTIPDITLPTISCPGNITTNNDANNCSTVVTFGTPVGTDNCPGSSTTQISGLASGSTFPVGTTTNTFQVTDAQSNIATCSFTVTIEDAQAPVVNCPSAITVTTDPGACTASVISPAATTSDNCGVTQLTWASTGATVMSSAPTGINQVGTQTFNRGISTITYTVRDAAGNISTCSYIVTVNDTEIPTVVCPANINTNTAPGVCNASVITPNPVTSDNCAVTQLTWTATGATVLSSALTGINNAGTQTFNRGITTITYTVADAGGNNSTCSFTITVTDNQAPSITCPATVNVNADNGLCSAASVNLGTPITADNCAILSVTNNAPATFPVGATTVTWTVTDVNGLTATCTQTVNVSDNQNPTITCPPTVNVNADPASCAATGVVLGTPVTADNCAVLSVTNNAPGSFPVGTTTVTWTVTDVNGRTATCTQSVIVTDNQAPTITCPATVNVNNNPGSCFATGVSLGTPTTADNCGVLSVSNNAPASFPIGTTVVTWTVTDNNGLTATCTQSVIVTDNQAPQLTCPNAVSVNADPGVCTTALSNVSLGNPTIVENCGVLSISNDAPANFPLGLTVVTWTVTDINGNTSTCTQNVTVIDNQSPTFVFCVGSNQSQSANNGACTYTHSGTAWDATGQDNCSTVSLSYTLSGSTTGTGSTLDGVIFNPGTTTVVWTVTDGSTNTATCSFTVTVFDGIFPTIVDCPADISVNVDAGTCGAIVNWTAPTANDNCTVSLFTNFSPSSNFPVGTTLVTYTAVDGFGNIATCSFNVTVSDNEAPVFVNCPSNTSSCNPVVVFEDPTASDNCGIVTVVQTSGPVSGSTLAPGTETVTYTATDSHGNVSTCSFTITIHPTPVATATASNVVCNGNSDGAIDLNVTTGTAPYNFLWSNSAITEDISGLAPGSYSVLVTDDNGCTTSASATVNEPAVITAAGNIVHATCFGASDGAVNVSVNGGIAPYTYSWTNGETTEDLFNLSAGIYTLTVTDANNCTSALDVTINEPTALEATATPVSSTCLSANGQLDLTVTGGTPSYTYDWSNGSTTQDLNNVNAGIYSVIITDAKGCTISFTDTILSEGTISVSAVVTNVACYGQSTGAINIATLSGTAPFTYSWNTGSTSEDLFNIPAGIYSLLAVDANGCQIGLNYMITQADSLFIELSSPVLSGGHNISTNGGSNGSIELDVTGGTLPYTYTWSNGATIEDLNDLTAGTYSVIVTDNNGCAVAGQITLDQPLPLDMPTGFSPNLDGKNDAFVVHGLEAFPDNEIFIYNRWGNLVYTTIGYNNDWMGTNTSGDHLPDATYFVILKVKGAEEITLTGYVDLRR